MDDAFYRLTALFKVEMERVTRGKYATPSAMPEILRNPIPDEMRDFVLTFARMIDVVERRETLQARKYKELEKTSVEQGEELRKWSAKVQELEERFAEDSASDRLTGMPNRKRMEEQYRFEITRAKRHGTALAALILDIDHFTKINEEFGEKNGDRLLQEVAKYIKGSLRSDDFPGRLGGGELLILAPATTREGMELVSERLRAGIEQLAISTQKGTMRTTVSVGVGIHFPGESQPENLFRRAANALYDAKINGRNCVEFAPQNPKIV